MNTYYSIRTLKAKDYREALAKVSLNEFDEMCDIIIEESEYNRNYHELYFKLREEFEQYKKQHPEHD